MKCSLIFILLVSPILASKLRNHKSIATEASARNPLRNTNMDRMSIDVTENFRNTTKYAPKFKSPGKLYSMDMKPAGSSVRFKCNAEGWSISPFPLTLKHRGKVVAIRNKFNISRNPVPNITWYKNNGLEIDRSYLKPKYGKWYIELQELIKADDGNYTCKVCNELGCIQHTTTLLVQERYPSKPYIKDGYPGNKTVFEMETVEFTCLIYSDLEPNIIWTWSLSNDTEKQVVESNDLDDKPEVLTLYNVSSANQGWYECMGINSLGNDTSRGYLTVKNKVDDAIEQKNNFFSISHTMITVLSTSISVILLSAIVIVIATFRKLKHEKIKKQEAIDATAALMAEQWAKVVKIEHNSEGDHLVLPTVSIEKVRYTEWKNGEVPSFSSEYIFPVDAKWEVQRENLVLGAILGKGEFGKVVKAEYSGTAYSRIPSTVAVKMLKEEHSDEDVIALVSEMEIMKKIGKHENVVNLLGCCTQDGPIYVIVEYANNGCLREYLKKHQPNKTNRLAEDTKKRLTPRDLVDFALQVAKGMEFLVSRGCIHRDLAARNVLVAARALKVADFGLARDVHDSDYYRKRAPGKLPVRWMAPESLAHNYYTSHSDVWSFGVLVWEIMTFGCTPYQGISVHVLYQYLKSGQRMEKPNDCSREIYALMLHCWTFNPKDRPRFSDLVVNLHEILNRLPK